MCEDPCYETITKTITKTIFENKTETLTKTVYDTVFDLKTVNDVKRVSDTFYRTEEFTYERPVYETLTRAVPYTVTRPVYEIRSKEVAYTQYVPSHATLKKSIPCKTFRTVTETSSRPITYQVPRTESYTDTIQVDKGHWETRIIRCPAGSEAKSSDKDGCSCSATPHVSCERVWVPKIELQHVTRCRTVYDTRTKIVPYARTRVVAETSTREVPYTITTMVPVTKTRTVSYKVCHMVSEERTKSVNCVVTRMITEKGVRTVPYTKIREIPCKRTVSVPRKVPRVITYTICHKVPRVVTCEVEIRVPCGSSGNSGKDLDLEPTPMEEKPQTPPNPEETTTAKASVAPRFELASNVNVLRSETDGRDYYLTGMELYRGAQFDLAAKEFDNASQASPDNAKYAYFRALALHCSGQANGAYEALAVAVELEKQSPVENWGRVMSRVQGNVRIWLEDGRKQLSKEA